MAAARKVKVEELLQGEYLLSEEGFPYLITPWGEKVSRVRVMGTVVEKWLREDGEYCTVYLDDGTGVISLRGWREGAKELNELKVGDLIDVIGRMREYLGERYLVPQLILRIKDPNWEVVRELEILLAKKKALAKGIRPKRFMEVKAETPPEEVEIEVEELELPQVPEELKRRALLVFEKLDRGEGVREEELARELGLGKKEVEDLLLVLMDEGEIFEAKTGRYRRVR
ncbi:MAG: OB-fold nucleic acid binding domain-containing protein [Candidatus Hadarchaeales archaeon]